MNLYSKNERILYISIRESFITNALRCLQSGGASLAPFYGLSDRILKRNGSSKSDRVKDGYIEKNLEFIFPVSKKLTT